MFASSVVSIALAIFSGMKSRHIYLEYEDAIASVPMEMQIDLTSASSTATRYEQTYYSPHGQSVYVAMITPTREELVAEPLRGLEGNITIVDNNGTVVLTENFRSKDVYYDYDNALLMHLRPFKPGLYTAILTITNGTSQPDVGVKRIYTKYGVCGIEVLPSYIYAAIAGFLTLLGLLLAVFSPSKPVSHNTRNDGPIPGITTRCTEDA